MARHGTGSPGQILTGSSGHRVKKVSRFHVWCICSVLGSIWEPKSVIKPQIAPARLETDISSIFRVVLSIGDVHSDLVAISEVVSMGFPLNKLRMVCNLTKLSTEYMNKKSYPSFQSNMSVCK
jgi:hypothetical protein